MARTAARGQVLVIFSVLLVVLLAFAGLAIDVGRQVAERRHVQTAADAGALAACRALIAGETDAAAALAAQQVALANLEGSPAAAIATIASPPSYEDEDGSGAIEADELVSGIVVAGGNVRVAITSSLDTVLAGVVGVDALETGARGRCSLQGGPAVPVVARRYGSPPGPGSGFVDHLATAATSTMGRVDPLDPRGYDGRVPASESVPGPAFAIYGPQSKAHNDSSFRGFIALDVRNFEGVDTRVYYNGVTAGSNPNTLKEMQGAYAAAGYPGPAFPPISSPPDGSTQVAVLSGNSSAHIVQPFSKGFRAGDRVLLAIYDGTVMEIPDFALIPPPEISLPSTTSTPVDGPSLSVSRNRQFLSTVTLSLHGDAAAVATGAPQLDILPDPSVTPPGTGDISEPIWSLNVFQPATNGTAVRMDDFRTNEVPPGIYTVWVEGVSGNPYYQRRRVRVPVRIQTDANGDGDYADVGDVRVTREFSLANSILDGSTAALGGTVSLPIQVSTTSGSSTTWDGGPSLETPVSLSWDPDSFTDCSLHPEPLGLGSISFSQPSVSPSTGTGTTSTLTVNTTGLAQGCYMFTVRAHGTNGDGQPVTRLERVRLTVATSSAGGQYVDIIGFAVFEVDSVGSNDITGHAVSGIYADPNHHGLRRAQRARLSPWSDTIP